MGASETVSSIPLPPRRTSLRTSVEAEGVQLVARFLSATGALSCEAAATLAGVRPDTIRRWRNRLPRALKRVTSRRMRAHLAGTPPPASDEGLQRLFSRVLRSVPDARAGGQVRGSRS
jgi:hypothetical protein